MDFSDTHRGTMFHNFLVLKFPEASSKSSSPENPNTDHLSKLASYVTFSALNKP